MMAKHKRPTLRDVAVAAGVSAPTVSNVLNGKDQLGKVKVSAATRRRILHAADEAGYTASLLGQSIRRGRTNQICISSRHLFTTRTAELVNAISSSCQSEGIRSLILPNHDWHAFLSGQGADGAVIDDERLDSDDLRKIRRLANTGTVIILLNSHARPNGFDVVRIGSLWAAQRLGLGVPADLEVLGTGNTPEALETGPPLSSLGSQPYSEEVAQLLIQRLQGAGPRRRTHVYPSQIWHRSTTKV